MEEVGWVSGKARFGNRNGFWRGGMHVDKHGYIMVRRGGKYVFEHRIVAERKLGRTLSRWEHVHHINENKLDNRPENLEVCAPAEHRKKHILKAWSRKYGQCTRCGKTDSAHAGHGLCFRCSMYLVAAKRRGHETERDKNGKRIFSPEHRGNLSLSMMGNRNGKSKRRRRNGISEDKI